MEQVVQELKNYSRWLQLEGKLPRLEEALAEAKELRIEAAGRVQVARWELERLEKPGFIQRLKGNLEERREEVYREHRSAQEKLQSAREEVELRTRELQEAREEFIALAGSWDAYLREKVSYGEAVEEESVFLAGICVGLANDCLDALEQARPWMQVDVMRRGVGYDNRKMEFLALAAEKAVRMKAILEQMPEESVQIPPYIRNPESFVTSVTMEYWQLDRLNLAIDQVREVRSNLKTR